MTRTGPASLPIRCSQGASNSPMSIYSTEYSARIGIGQNNIDKKDNGLHRKTGYKSNFRPGVYYSRKLDDLDNPTIIPVLEENYVSVNSASIPKPPRGATGFECIPQTLAQGGSGFTRPKYISTPYSTKKMMKETENRKNYLGRQPDRMDTSGKQIGVKQYSGFTHHIEYDPIEYRPRDAFLGDQESWQKICRQIGASEHQNSFYRPRWLNGKEYIKNVNNSVHTYSRETTVPPYEEAKGIHTWTNENQLHPKTEKRIKKKDPAEGINLNKPIRYETVARHTYKYQPFQARDTYNLKASANACKQSSGYCCNIDRYVEPPKDNQRFATYYCYWFDDKSKRALEGRQNIFGINKQSDNGFTKSTAGYKQQQQRHPNADMPPWKSADSLKTNMEAKQMTIAHPATFDTTRHYKLRA